MDKISAIDISVARLHTQNKYLVGKIFVSLIYDLTLPSIAGILFLTDEKQCFLEVLTTLNLFLIYVLDEITLLIY